MVCLWYVYVADICGCVRPFLLNTQVNIEYKNKETQTERMQNKVYSTLGTDVQYAEFFLDWRLRINLTLIKYTPLWIMNESVKKRSL